MTHLFFSTPPLSDNECKYRVHSVTLVEYRIPVGTQLHLLQCHRENDLFVLIDKNLVSSFLVLSISSCSVCLDRLNVYGHTPVCEILDQNSRALEQQ